MGLDPITVTLSTFERLETLRGELKVREEELQNVERELRKALRLLATDRYLKTVSPFYARRPAPPETAAVPEIERRRGALYQVIQAIRAEIPRLEATAGGRQPPPRAGRRRNRFE